MEKDNGIANPDNKALRIKRVKLIKKWIIIIALTLLILPTILCIIMFLKLNSLQKQIDVLMIQRYGTTYNGKDSVNHNIAHAATKNEMNTQKAIPDIENLYKFNEEFPTSLEEIAENEYNNDGVQYDKNTTANNTLKNSVSDKDTKINENPENNTAITDTSKKALAGNVTTKNSVTINKSTGTVKSNQEKESSKAEAANNGKKTVDISSESDAKGNKLEFSNKEVYLTFDDGPSKYTDDILSLLSKYHVKATFFVIGKTDDYSKKMYKKIVEEGHALGMHSYSHDYNIIYNSLEDFDKDFTRIRNLLYDTTGYISNIYRFPGGSSNEVGKEDVSVFIKYLNKKSVVYFDWNVASGDATGINYTAQELYDNVINGIKLHDRSIVLMHDTDVKKNTIKSLDMILKKLTKEGANILPLDENVLPIQQVKINSSTQKNK